MQDRVYEVGQRPWVTFLPLPQNPEHRSQGFLKKGGAVIKHPESCLQYRAEAEGYRLSKQSGCGV